MKNHTPESQMPTHRKQLKKTRIIRRIFSKTTNAITRSNAATTFQDGRALSSEIPNMNVGRAITVIVAVHVICLAGYFFREKIIRERAREVTQAASEMTPTSPYAAATIASVDSLPEVKPGDRMHFVKVNDTYEQIATDHGVSVEELKAANNNTKIFPGLNLKVPPRTAQPIISDKIDQLKNPLTNNHIAAVPPVSEQEAVPETPRRAIPVSMSHRTHVVKKGETLYSIARIHKLTIDDLVKANRIKNPAALRIGTALKLPSK